MSSKDQYPADRKWEQDYLDRQRVPGTQAYRCPFCGDFTRTKRELKDHFLKSCGRMPTTSQIGKPKRPTPNFNKPGKPKQRLSVQSVPDDQTRCKRCGRSVELRELDQHIKEFHTKSPVVEPKPAAPASRTEATNRAREILNLRAAELGMSPIGTSTSNRKESAREQTHSLEYVPCSCGGSNENCSHCFGLGQTRRHHEVFTHHVPYVATHSTLNTRACGHCSFEGTAAELIYHVRTAHPESRVYGLVRKKKPRKKQTTKQSKSLRSTDQLGFSPDIGTHTADKSEPSLSEISRDRTLVCAACKKEFPIERYNSHICTPVFKSVLWQKCGVCGAMVKKLKRHLSKMHRDTAAAIVSRARTTNAKVKPLVGRTEAIERWKADVEGHQSLIQRNLDHTKGYAHPFREEGRFGSHPSHDSFDDESTS